MSISNALTLILTIVAILTLFLNYLNSSQDTKQNLKLFLIKVKNRAMYSFMQLGTLAVALYFFYLSIEFIFSDVPISRIDLFIAPMYLFCIFSYGGLSALIYSSKKEILKEFDNPKRASE